MDTHLSFNRVEQLKGFIESNPDDPFPRYGLAMELKKLGRHAEAETVFTELMSRFPDYTPTYFHAGANLTELGRPADARKIYEAGIKACARKNDLHTKGEIEQALAELAADPD